MNGLSIFKEIKRLVMEDPVLKESLRGIYTYVPTEASYPFLVASSLTNESPCGTWGIAHVSLKTISHYKGEKEIQKLHEALLKVFSHAESDICFKVEKTLITPLKEGESISEINLRVRGRIEHEDA